MARRRRNWRFEKWDMNSKFEYNIALDLKERGVDFDYEAETYEYTVAVVGTKCPECGSGPATKKARYTPDFFLPNGIIVETKGRWDSQDRKKMVAMKEQHPDLDIRILFLADNWITKRHKDRYSTWCDKKGLTYAIGKTIPEEWLV